MPDPAKEWESMAASLHAKTGRTLEGWVALVRDEGLSRHGAITKLLTTEHGLTGGYANFIALTALRPAEPTDQAGQVDMIYSGRNAALRPLHDAVIDAIEGFGAMEQSPKKAWVSLRRSKQFAMVGPGTKGRLDVCLNLDEVPAGHRLEAMTGMATRRVRVSRADEIDAELVGWLRAAYDKS